MNREPVELLEDGVDVLTEEKAVSVTKAAVSSTQACTTCIGGREQ